MPRSPGGTKIRTVTNTEVFYNPFADGYTDNPYDHYRELRDADPVHQTPFGVWFLFRYEDVRRILRDPGMSVEDAKAHPTMMTEVVEQLMGDDLERGNHAMLNQDPPNHTRLRRLVSKAFTPRMIEQLRGRIEELVDESLGKAAAAGGMELMDDYAFRLPFTVITEMLGMPPTDTVELRRLSGLLVRTLEPLMDPNLMLEINAAGRAMETLIRDAITWKRARPSDDLLSALIAAEEEGDRLSELELIDQVTLLYIAGHETTVNLIGNGTLALLRHPAQAALLRKNSTLTPAAVEELLRYDAPVQMSRRVTLQEIEVGGKVIEPGAFAVVGLASANRDPAYWGPTADVVDLQRPNAADHVSFGGGHHHCLGAALARLEAEVAIGRLFQRFETIEAMAEPVWNGRINLRGMTSLPLRVRAD
jgi:cytochrome P450